MPDLISKEAFDALIAYDSDTGEFTRKVRMAQRAPAGEVIRSKDANGYTRFKIDGRAYLGHRLAFLTMTGAFPGLDVDHINRNPSDNRWCNLRLVNKSLNARNSKLRASNTSGFFGVHYVPVLQRWSARITVNWRRWVIGYFSTPEEAARARDAVAWLIDPEHFTLNFPELSGI
jgi:hypothetical protein